jgi:putative ABC transport system permease protein
MLADIKFALRMFAKSPGFTAVAVLALALGIGANTALFSVINSVLLKPLSYREPARLIRIYETFLPDGFGSVSPANLADWRQQSHAFERLESFTAGSINLQSDGNPERIPSIATTAGMFDMLEAKPILGRTFLPGEDLAGGPDIVVISERLWRGRFAGNPNLLGSRITLDGKATTVVGIMPADFEFPPGSPQRTIWLPMQLPPELASARGNHFLSVIGRLRPGIDRTAALSEMKQIAAGMATAFPDRQKGRSVRLLPLQDSLVGDIRPALLVLMGAVGCVLLIACSNVANLLLARAAARGREVAVRAALGASRSRLIRQFLTESILLAIAGGALGAIFAAWGTGALVALTANQIPRAAEIHLDGTVFLFLLVVCVASGVVFGIVPAFQSADSRFMDRLREGGRGGSGGSTAFRNALIVTEFALALILLTGAGLLMRSFLALNATGSGLHAEGVLTMSVSVPEEKYPKNAMWRQFYEPALDRIRALPGVQSAGMIQLLPLQNWGWNGDFTIDGRPAEKPGRQPLAEYREISPGYFQTMGIPILQGRDFSIEDSPDAPHVALINDTLAKRYFPGENPVGRRIQWDGWRTIAGVTGDVRQAGLDQKPFPELYFPAAQRPGAISGMTLVIRTSVEPSSITHAVESAVRSVDSSQPVFGVKTMQRVISDSLSSQRLYVWLLGIFAGIAVILASAGIYGVMSYLVTQRTREFGVRMALGASTRDILRTVLRQALILVAAGAGIGLVGAFALTRLLTRFLFGVRPTDPVTFGAVSLLLVAVALLASWLPARRATKVDPMVALRYE